jgi:hypothetical protein
MPRFDHKARARFGATRDEALATVNGTMYALRTQRHW